MPIDAPPDEQAEKQLALIRSATLQSITKTSRKASPFGAGRH